MDTRDELADELTAILRACRELTPDTDRYLAERFVDHIEKRTTEVQRRQRTTRRKPGTPRRTVGALVVAALALAIGAPLHFHSSLRGAQPGGQAFAVPCDWQRQTLVFNSPSAEGQWQAGANPKSYQILGNRFDTNGKSILSVLHWECH